MSHHVLTLSCRDDYEIVATVTTYLTRHDGFILESAQYSDTETNRFFMRIMFRTKEDRAPHDEIKNGFAAIAERFNMKWSLHATDERPRLLIMVSKLSHCLNTLLYRYSSGNLPVEIPAIVSNHPDLEQMAKWYKIPYHHFPITSETKAAQEEQIIQLTDSLEIDLVVLARYMQILSPSLVAKLEGRCINIHHSFLPSFKGARPYHQAYTRGVKLIGATAHYVSNDLDEGPIIEQEVQPVDHTAQPSDLVAVGQDIESLVLLRAIKLHIQHRVFINGNKTVIFK